MFLLKLLTYINLCENQNLSPLASFTQTGNNWLVRAVREMIESLKWYYDQKKIFFLGFQNYVN